MFGRLNSRRSISGFIMVLMFGVLAVVTLAVGGANVVVNAQSPSQDTDGLKPKGKSADPLTSQILYGFPLTITVEDTTQMDIRYRNAAETQFFGNDAEGAYLWVKIGSQTKVFGPAYVPAGRNVNPYTFVSNSKTGSGTPANPWVVTTVESVPGSTLRLTQRATYVNGAEFVNLQFQLSQVAGSAPVTATLFHAADLYTAGSDLGYGYYDSTTGGVGDYITRSNGIVLYQQFVPSTPAAAYMESFYSTIWAAIGDTAGPGSGFDNSIISDTLHDAGAGLQWNLTVPASGSVTVGDTDLFSPHASLCGAFSDVPYGSVYYDYIYFLSCQHIVSGYDDTTFRPNNPALRAQLCKMVVLGQGWPINTTGGPHFTDVPPTNVYYPYVETAYNRGIISGYGSVFRWNANISRGQVTKIIVGARGWPINTTGGPHFTDVPPSNVFYNWIETAYNRGIISGYGNNTFQSNTDITRGQLSKVLYLALQQP